jgi:steroid 5-alpha reductase family enzyme
MLTVFITTALLIFITMTLVWLLSLLTRKMSIVDGFWGIGFIGIVLYHFFSGIEMEPRRFIVTYLVVLWGLRLAGHIFYRNHGKPEDPKYAAWRGDWGKNTWWISYFKVFLLQGVLMFIIALPLQVVMLSCGPTLSRLDWVGVALWFFGWLFETAADYQLLKFKKQPANKGLVMNKGVWRYSRHPNYFGETVVWWGIFIISISSGYWYISILSPLLITFLLLKVSGVTLLEKRYAGNDAYAEYKKITSSFFPLPPKNVSRK